LTYIKNQDDENMKSVSGVMAVNTATFPEPVIATYYEQVVVDLAKRRDELRNQIREIDTAVNVLREILREFGHRKFGA
jgi:hypothetical protein